MNETHNSVLIFLVDKEIKSILENLRVIQHGRLWGKEEQARELRNELIAIFFIRKSLGKYEYIERDVECSLEKIKENLGELNA